MSVTLTLDLQVAKAIQGLASVIAKEGEYDKALLKTIGITREQAKANQELISVQKQSHDLVVAFKKHESQLEREHAQAARYNLRGFQEQGAAAEKVLMTTERYLKGIGVAQKQALGPEMLAGVVSMAAGYASFAVVVGKVHEGLRAVRTEMDAAAMRREGLLGAFQELNSASGGDPAKVAAGDRFARMLTGTGITKEDALKAVSLGRQLPGFSDADVAAAAKTQAAFGGNLADKLKFASTVKQAYPGQFVGAAGTERITDLSTAAANIGSWTPSDVPRVMPAAMVSGKRLGASPEELLAAGSVLSKVYAASPETAGDRLGLLVNRLAMDPAFQGKGLAGSLKIMGRMKKEDYASFLGDTSADPTMNDEEYRAHVGKRIEMAQAINALSDGFKDLVDTTKALQEVSKKSGTGESISARAAASVGQIPQISETITAKMEKERQAQAHEDTQATYAQRQAASRSRADVAMMGAGVPDFARAMGRILSEPAHLVAPLLGGAPEGAGLLDMMTAHMLTGGSQTTARAISATPEGTIANAGADAIVRKLQELIGIVSANNQQVPARAQQYFYGGGM